MKPDTTPLTEEQKKLVEQFQYVPAYMFKKIWPNPKSSGVVRVCGRDEILSEGFWCLIRCAKAWDSTRGVKFLSYACRCVACQMKSAYLKTFIIHAGRKGDGQYWKKAYALNANLRRIERFGDETWQPSDRGESPFDAACKGELNEIVMQTLDKLPEKQANALKLRYLEGKSLSAIGESMNITKEGARQLCGRGMENLRYRTELLKFLL